MMNTWGYPNSVVSQVGVRGKGLTRSKAGCSHPWKKINKKIKILIHQYIISYYCSFFLAAYFSKRREKKQYYKTKKRYKQQ